MHRYARDLYMTDRLDSSIWKIASLDMTGAFPSLLSAPQAVRLCRPRRNPAVVKRCVSIRTIGLSVAGSYSRRKGTSRGADVSAPRAAFVTEHTPQMNISPVSRALKRST